MFLCEDDPTLEQVAWKGGGFSVSGDSKYLTGHGPVAGSFSQLCFKQGGWTR